MFYISPLEQFAVYSIHPPIMFSVSFTNATLFMCLTLLTMCYVQLILGLNERPVYTDTGLYLFRNIFFFVYDFVKENLGKDSPKFFYTIFYLFIFLFISNIIGMITYSFTVASQLILTFTLAFSFFFALNFIGIRKHGFKFLNLFFPSGAPLAIAPLLVAIETISYIARVFSLAIRLFANIMSGHTLLKILSGFGVTLINTFGLLFFTSIFCIIIVIAITGLELSIAFLQAYVFSILICIYLNDVLNLH